MNGAITDRVEEQRHKMAAGYFSSISIISLAVLIVAVAISPDLFSDIPAMSILITAVVLIALILVYRHRARKYGGQFIEWREDRIVYKTRNRLLSAIPIENIKEIVIQFDVIELHLVDGTHTRINFSDFHDVEDRKRIKDNFEKLKTMRQG